MVRERSAAAFYDNLHRAAFAASGSPLLIFPSAADTDALCAFKIVTQLLASASIRYSAYPVAGSEKPHELAGRLLRSADQALVALLINWGASHDLLRLLELGPLAQVFVVDSHRPIHLRNLRDDNRQVSVLWTIEDEKSAQVTYDFEINDLIHCSTSLPSDDETEEDEEDDSDDDEVEGAVEASPRILPLNEEEKNVRKRKREYYNKGSFHGRPAGCLMFDMAHALHKNNNELLWLACVSLTDQYVHDRLTAERYKAGVMELEGFVNLDVNTNIMLKDGTSVRLPDVSRIIHEIEPRLMLLREWNLYDSMLCSSYVATKLKTWSDPGLRRLRLLLARMGIPLVECQQKYQHMRSEIKKRLIEEFNLIQTESDLTELFYSSFQMLHGYNSKVSAADVVYGVTALLETWKEDPDSWADQFWKAFSALSPGHWETLRAGMALAIKVQKAILQQGSVAIARKGVIGSCRAFRYLTMDMNADTELLSHPLCLTRFCHFLMDALTEQGMKSKPMICASPAPGKSRFYLIVGVSMRPEHGKTYANTFGLAFSSVAENLGVEYSRNAFESCWMLIEHSAVNNFVLRLQEKLS